MNVKPIETAYNGFLFRSRLEARWAYFLDMLGIKYDYEPEGYDLGELGYYLPDFYLPDFGCFAEVKPGTFDPEQKRKCSLLPSPCLLLDGLPRETGYEIVDHYGSDWNGLFIDLNKSIFRKRLWFTGDLSRTMEDSYGDDYSISVVYAKSARFEYGEIPNAKRK